MNTIFIGTASWTDKSLVDSGLFYPGTVRTPEDRLRFYAARFGVVEVDSTYYGLPSERNAQLWVGRTPAGFVFDVKAFRLFTGHQTSPTALPKDIRDALGATGKRNFYYRDLPEEIVDELWSRFGSAIEPLKQAGKMGAVLFQFAPWFIFAPSNLAHVLRCQEMLEGFQLAVEFRNKSWFSDKRRAEVLAFEREHGLVHVVVDEPQGFPSSIPTVWEATCRDLAIVRLHGRNREMWERKNLATSAERFNYLYSEAELADLAEPVRKLSATTRRVHVLFNNCHEDKAPRNALQFARILGQGA